MSILFLILTHLTFSYNAEHLKALLTRDNPNIWDNLRKKHPSLKLDLSHAVIDGIHFRGNFSNVNFRYAKITNSSIAESDFINTDLSYSVIKSLEGFMPQRPNHVTLNCKNSLFVKSQLLSVKILFAEFTHVNFNDSEIRDSQIDASTFINVNLKNIKIINSVITNKFQGVDFSNAFFSNSRITATYIINALFRNAKIIKSGLFLFKTNNLDFTHSSLIKVEFGGSLLTNVSFVNVNLTDSSFGDKYYPEAILTNVNFTNANLTNVNFHKSKFHNVIFKNADMTGAKLERKWFAYVKKQGVRNFDKIQWM